MFLTLCFPVLLEPFLDSRLLNWDLVSWDLSSQDPSTLSLWDTELDGSSEPLTLVPLYPLLFLPCAPGACASWTYSSWISEILVAWASLASALSYWDLRSWYPVILGTQQNGDYSTLLLCIYLVSW